MQWRFKFTIGDAQVKIFRLDSSVYMVYPLRTINTNHVCPKVKTISQYRSSQAKHSSSTLGVTIRTMDHVSPLMRQRMSRCTPSGSIGPGPWGNFSTSPKTRSSQARSRHFGPKSQESSMLMNFSKNWLSSRIQWPWTTRHSPAQESWLLVGWSFSRLDSAPGRSAIKPPFLCTTITSLPFRLSNPQKQWERCTIMILHWLLIYTSMKHS